MFSDDFDGKLRIKDKKAEEVLELYSFCKEFGWTTEEYYNTPMTDILRLRSVMNALSIAESEYTRRQKKK